jgi:putative ABC transport system permease protein
MGMDAIRRWLRRLAFAARADRHAADLAAELEAHRARLEANLRADGIPPAEAAARSRRAMGNVTLAREDARHVWIGATWHRLWRDGVYGARALRREPTFALAALLTLTLGIATTTTVFSVVDAELWKPLPFPDAHRLVAVVAAKAGGGYESLRESEVAEWRAHARLTQYIVSASSTRRVSRVDGRLESVSVRPISADFLDVLGATPRMGRGFKTDDQNGPRTAVLSDAGWTRLFNRDPSVIGGTLILDDEAFAIVGVTAGTRFEFTTDPDVFVLLDTTASTAARAGSTLEVYGRLRPETTVEAAQAELQSLAARTMGTPPSDRSGRTVRLNGLQQWATGYNWREMWFFLGAATLVLILSCLNVAGLLLARALRRQREFAIRGALGGGRAALIRQLVVEGGLLALPAAVAGVLLARWLLGVLSLHVPPGHLERGGHLALDFRALAFAVGLCALTTAMLAMAPLVFARRIDLNVMLGHARTIGPSPRQRRVRTTLLIAQVTATPVLLAGAALFVLSFLQLTQTPLGFEPANRATLRLSLSGARYTGDAAVAAFSTRLRELAAATGGVLEAAVGSSSPLDSRGGAAVQIVVPDRPRPVRGQEPTALIKTVSPRYFRALGIRQIAGRDFGEADAYGAPRVAIVNERLARWMFPGENAVGRQLELIPRLRTGWTSRPGTVVIVGIVADVRNFAINEAEFNSVYVAFAQAPAPTFELVASTALPAADVIPALRAAVGQLDSALPVLAATTMAQRLDLTLQGDRFNLAVIVFFAAAATLLAAVGIYGAMACAVQERTREFGIRMALGASGHAILGSALRGAVRIGAAGSLLGGALTILVARLLGNALYLVPGQHGGLLYGVKTTDPIALAAACTGVFVIVVGASLVPARQATRIDPLNALRTE